MQVPTQEFEKDYASLDTNIDIINNTQDTNYHKEETANPKININNDNEDNIDLESKEPIKIIKNWRGLGCKTKKDHHIMQLQILKLFIQINIKN